MMGLSESVANAGGSIAAVDFALAGSNNMPKGSVRSHDCPGWTVGISAGVSLACGTFRTGPDVRLEPVMRPEPDVDSRRRRKPRSGRGLLRGATPRKRARSRRTIAMLSRSFPCRTSLTAVSHRAPGPLLQPEILRPARDQGVCDGCPMAARLRHQRRLLEFRLRRLSGRGAETTEGPGLTRCGLRGSVPQRRTLWLTAANGYFCNPCRLAGNRMQFVRLNAAHTVACTAHSPPILTVS